MHLIDDYLSKADWRVKENSNANFSLQGLNHYTIGGIVSGYWLNNVYDNEIAIAHREGSIHIHDLSCLSSYCTGWDLHDLLVYGYGGVDSKVSASPAKHLSSALGQLVNFFYTMAGEVAGEHIDIIC